MSDKNDAQAIIDEMKRLQEPRFISLDGLKTEIMSAPSGHTLHSLKPFLDERLPAPRRREGTAMLLSLQSIIDWTNRHKGDSSVIFANNNPSEPSLLSVIDYNREGADDDDTAMTKARFGTHRGMYRFPLSKAWKAWADVDGKSMSQASFAAFLEDRIGDVLVPPANGAKEDDAKLLDTVQQIGGVPVGPSRLLELSRGLQITEASRVKNVVNLSSGEVQVVYETEHRDAAGEPLKVPNVFLIGIPVFEVGAAYRMPVRLRYRRTEGTILWSVIRYRPEIYFDAAFNEAVEDAREKTSLPVFLGLPERK